MEHGRRGSIERGYNKTRYALYCNQGTPEVYIEGQKAATVENGKAKWVSLPVSVLDGIMAMKWMECILDGKGNGLNRDQEISFY